MRLLLADAIKHRRTWVVSLTFLGPFGVVLMGVIDFALRRELFEHEVVRSGPWRTVMDQIGMLDVAAIVLGVALLTSMVFDVDHRSLAWKQLFALPVSRVGVYLTKLLVVALLMATASLLAAAGTAGIWMWLDFGPLPWARLGLLAVVPWVAALPLIAFQGLLSAHIRNQAIALTAGVAGVVMALFGASLPQWAPWTPSVDSMMWITSGVGSVWQILGYACVTALVFAGAGAFVFARRDVI